MDRYTFFRKLGVANCRIAGAYDVFSKSCGVKPNLLWLVSALNDGEMHTQSQICFDWGFPRTTVNTLVKELESEGLVRLKPVPGTRRELYVELTEDGKVYADEMLKPVYETEDKLFRKYFGERNEEFVEDLERFSLVMKQYFITGEYPQNVEELEEKLK